MVALVAAWFSVAVAIPVECDPVAAATLLTDARIEERRAPVSHAELLPGLALASARTSDPLRQALAQMCDGDVQLSLARSDLWEGPEWQDHTFLLSRTEQQGCALATQSIAISVAVSTDTAPRYELRSTQPEAHTPIGDCGIATEYREEETIAGNQGPVRVVLAKDMVDGQIAGSTVIVRRAARAGWIEQVLLETAPDRLLTDGKGPIISISDKGGKTWVVAHADRTGAPPNCEEVPSHIVWTWDDQLAQWLPHDKRDALALLAQAGSWRLAGTDGWFLIMDVREEDEDPDILNQTLRRIQKRSAEPLYLMESSLFPGLNPGFWLIAPAPWATQQEAQAAKKRWFSWRRSYVKRGWEATSGCDSSETPR